MPDLLPPDTRVAPALSATSDMPQLALPEPVPESVSDAKPADAPASDAKPADTAVADTAAEGEAKAVEGDAKPDADAKTAEGEADAKPAKKPISERFSEITAQRKAAEDRANRAVEAANTATEALNKALSTIEQLTGKSAKDTASAVAQEDPRPQRETFDNPAAYDAAMVEWGARQGARAALAKVEADQALAKKEADAKAEADKKAKDEADRKTAADKVAQEWMGKVAKVAEEFPDFNEVVSNDDLHITPLMTDAIVASDIGPSIAYHLGKNPEEAARIAALPPLRQAIEIGKLEAELGRPKPKTSRAPPPIKPLGSSAPAATKTIYDLGNEEGPGAMEAYVAARKAEKAASRPN